MSALNNRHNEILEMLREAAEKGHAFIGEYITEDGPVSLWATTKDPKAITVHDEQESK